MADPDPLEQLRAQVRATRQAAERLMDEGIPAGGWASPDERPGAFAEEIEALARVLQALRELLRQLLLVARALIDWLVARLEEREGGPAAPGAEPVQDIPIA
jgi:hypothetical protein